MEDQERPESSPAEEIARLREELAVAREEVERFRDRWMRERADLENVKKRADRERGEAVRYGNERLIGDLLPVFDSLERAIQSAEQGAGGQGLLEGVRLVAKALLDVLTRHGVTRVEAVGHPFDPNQHEAVAHLEDDQHRAGMVTEEHRGGFRLHDRLLRPAMVSVSKGPRGGSDLAKPQGRD